MDQSIPLIITIVPNPDIFSYPEIPNMFTGPLNSSTESESSTQSASSSTESELSTQSSSAESVETDVSFNTVRYDIVNASDSDNDNNDDNNTVWSLDFNAVDVSDNDDDNNTVWSLDVGVSVDDKNNDTVLSLDCDGVNIYNDNNVHNTMIGLNITTFNPNLHITTPITTHTTTMTIDNNEMDIES